MRLVFSIDPHNSGISSNHQGGRFTATQTKTQPRVVTGRIGMTERENKKEREREGETLEGLNPSEMLAH